MVYFSDGAKIKLLLYCILVKPLQHLIVINTPSHLRAFWRALLVDCGFHSYKKGKRKTRVIRKVEVSLLLLNLRDLGNIHVQMMNRENTLTLLSLKLRRKIWNGGRIWETLDFRWQLKKWKVMTFSREKWGEAKNTDVWRVNWERGSHKGKWEGVARDIRQTEGKCHGN